MRRALFAAAAGLALTSPAPMVSPPQEPRTVTWFKAHIPELRAELAACKDDPGKARDTAECTTLNMPNGN